MAHFVVIVGDAPEFLSLRLAIGVQNAPLQKDAFKDSLSRYREIRITVTGRKSGRKFSVPVWFVSEGDKLYLLPVQGSDTQRYKNMLKHPKLGIYARGAEAEFQAVPISDPTQVKQVVERFREKYGAVDVKKYYSRFDVAVVIPLG